MYKAIHTQQVTKKIPTHPHIVQQLYCYIDIIDNFQIKLLQQSHGYKLGQSPHIEETGKQMKKCVQIESYQGIIH